jgi:hypothetical protein
MQAYAAWWWTTARHWTQIAVFSPLVIGARLWSMGAAHPAPSQQAEMARMVIEKGEAFAESSAAVWLAAMDGQQRAWQKAWRAGRPLPAAADFALSAATARKIGGAWRPVSRRVSANARRLSGRSKGRPKAR